MCIIIVAVWYPLPSVKLRVLHFLYVNINYNEIKMLQIIVVKSGTYKKKTPHDSMYSW